MRIPNRNSIVTRTEIPASSGCVAEPRVCPRLIRQNRPISNITALAAACRQYDNRYQRRIPELNGMGRCDLLIGKMNIMAESGKPLSNTSSEKVMRSRF